MNKSKFRKYTVGEQEEAVQLYRSLNQLTLKELQDIAEQKHVIVSWHRRKPTRLAYIYEILAKRYGHNIVLTESMAKEMEGAAL
jgi:hypothetical protein